MQQVLNVDPERELKFKGSFNDPIAVDLKLTNPSALKVCFKIKTTAPKQYTVRPSNGIVEPGNHTTVTITLHPFEYDPTAKYSHKFMVQSLVVPDGSSADIEDLWRDASLELIMNTKLRCALEHAADPNQTQDLQSKTNDRLVDDSAAEQQRLMAENTKLKGSYSQKCEAEKILSWMLPEMARRQRYSFFPKYDNLEGARLRQMIVLEQDRVTHMKDTMDSLHSGSCMRYFISLLILVIGVAFGCYVGKTFL